MEKDSKILVAGAKGMVGSAIVRRLEREGYTDICCAHRDEVNFTSQMQTNYFFKHNEFEYVFVAAAKVGGILANRDYKADVINDNLMIQTNIIRNAHKFGVKKLLFLGSSCIYPKYAPQPLKEESLLTGALESTNEPYAIAKIAGIKMCEAYRDQYGCNFISAMPTNLYGPGDNYHRENSHVLPALIRKIHEAKDSDSETVTIWGTGAARREFLHTDDLADAVHFTFGLDDPPDWVNVGTGMDLSILSLAKLIAKVVGFEGEILTDPGRPEGTPVKCNEMSRLHELGWRHQIDLEDGLRMTYQSFLSDLEAGSLRSF